MIVSFPSPIHVFESTRIVPKDEPTQYAHVPSRPIGLVFQPPIDLQPADQIWIDLRDSQVHVVMRGGIAIWRSGWWN